MAARRGTTLPPLSPCAAGQRSPMAPCAPLPPSRPGAHLSAAAEPARAARGRCRASPAAGPPRAWRRPRCVTGGGRSQPRRLTSRPRRSRVTSWEAGGSRSAAAPPIAPCQPPQPAPARGPAPAPAPRLLFRSQGRAWAPHSASSVRMWRHRPVPLVPVLTAHRTGARLQPAAPGAAGFSPSQLPGRSRREGAGRGE